jgi:hypothetical protein
MLKILLGVLAVLCLASAALAAAATVSIRDTRLDGTWNETQFTWDDLRVSFDVVLSTNGSSVPPMWAFGLLASLTNAHSGNTLSDLNITTSSWMNQYNGTAGQALMTGGRDYAWRLSNDTSTCMVQNAGTLNWSWASGAVGNPSQPVADGDVLAHITFVYPYTPALFSGGVVITLRGDGENDSHVRVPYGVLDNGATVDFAVSNNNTYLLPEPATLALLAAGLCGLAARRRGKGR